MSAIYSGQDCRSPRSRDDNILRVCRAKKCDLSGHGSSEVNKCRMKILTST